MATDPAREAARSDALYDASDKEAAQLAKFYKEEDRRLRQGLEGAAAGLGIPITASGVEGALSDMGATKRATAEAAGWAADVLPERSVEAGMAARRAHLAQSPSWVNRNEPLPGSRDTSENLGRMYENLKHELSYIDQPPKGWGEGGGASGIQPGGPGPMSSRTPELETRLANVRQRMEPFFKADLSAYKQMASEGVAAAGKEARAVASEAADYAAKLKGTMGERLGQASRLAGPLMAGAEIAGVLYNSMSDAGDTTHTIRQAAHTIGRPVSASDLPRAYGYLLVYPDAAQALWDDGSITDELYTMLNEDPRREEAIAAMQANKQATERDAQARQAAQAQATYERNPRS